MSVIGQTAAPKGRKKIAQGKAYRAAALGQVSQNTSSPERAKESGCSAGRIEHSPRRVKPETSNLMWIYYGIHRRVL
jgi:hypothetical protein